MDLVFFLARPPFLVVGPPGPPFARLSALSLPPLPPLVAPAWRAS
ncbi:1-deoxy-D-xylulose-5-phosphate synthase, partial [Mycobacterium tuberculosis]